MRLGQKKGVHLCCGTAHGFFPLQGEDVALEAWGHSDRCENIIDRT